jgi:beta-lactam-binding protein with PASTA domain
VKVVFKKSKRPKGIVLKQSRKAGKKLKWHAVVKLTVAKHPVRHRAKKH